MGGISGSEYYYMKLLPALRRKGIDAIFASVQHPDNANRNEPLYSHFKAENVPYFVLDSSSSLNFKILDWIAKIIKTENIDILHTNLIHADLWGALTKIRFGKKVTFVSTKHGYGKGSQDVFTAQSVLAKDSFFFISRFVARYLDGAAVVSKWLYNRLVSNKMLKPTIASVVQLGFDFNEVKITQDTSLRFSSEQAIIVGRLIPYKQHLLAFEAWKKVVIVFPNAVLVIVGDGSYSQVLKKKVTELSLDNNIRFEGFKTNVHDYLANSDISITPSSAEGFGIVILEAWYHNLAAVAFDVPAPNEIITKGKNGILIKPYDIDELATKLVALFTNKALLKNLGDAGKLSLKNNFNEDLMVDKTILMYRKFRISL